MNKNVLTSCLLAALLCLLYACGVCRAESKQAELSYTDVVDYSYTTTNIDSQGLVKKLKFSLLAADGSVNTDAGGGNIAYRFRVEALRGEIPTDSTTGNGIPPNYPTSTPTNIAGGDTGGSTNSYTAGAPSDIAYVNVVLGVCEFYMYWSSDTGDTLTVTLQKVTMNDAALGTYTTVDIKKKDIQLTGTPTLLVTVSPKTSSLYVGETVQLTATSTSQSVETFTWVSSDNNVASVDTSGKVTAKAAGTATITVTGGTSGKSDTAVITVSNIPVATPVKYYLPQLYAKEPWQAFLMGVNTDIISSTVKITLRDSSGQIVGSTLETSVAAGKRVIVVVNGSTFGGTMPADGRVWVEIESLAGTNWRGVYVDMSAGIGTFVWCEPASTSNTLYLPYVNNISPAECYIVVANPGVTSISVSHNVYQNGLSAGQSLSYSILPGGFSIRSLAEAVGGDFGGYGWVKMTSTESTSFCATLIYLNETYGRNAYTGINAIPSTGNVNSSAIFPFLLEQNGGWQSFIVAMNASTASGYITLDAYNYAGTRIGAPKTLSVISNGQRIVDIDSSTFGAALPADGTFSISVSNSGGTMYVQALQVNFGTTSINDVMLINPAASTAVESAVLGYLSNVSPLGSSFVVHNSGTTPRTFSANLYDSNGQLLASKTLENIPQNGFVFQDLGAISASFNGEGWLKVTPTSSFSDQKFNVFGIMSTKQGNYSGIITSQNK